MRTSSPYYSDVVVAIETLLRATFPARDLSVSVASVDSPGVWIRVMIWPPAAESSEWACFKCGGVHPIYGPNVVAFARAELAREKRDFDVRPGAKPEASQ